MRVPLSSRTACLLATSLLFGGLLLVAGCTSSNKTDADTGIQRDTISYHANGSPRSVTIRRGDSVISEETYRPSGMLRRVAKGDSVQRYFDLHDPDSSAVLKDYLQGRWRNLSADTTSDQASAYYIFEDEQLIFQNASAAPLESLSVTYNDHRKLVTGTGMTVQPVIVAFDTVEVTGYTLIRRPPVDSL